MKLQPTRFAIGIAVLLIGAATLGAEDKKFDADALYRSYERIRLTLVNDSMEGVKESAGEIVYQLKRLKSEPTAEAAGVPAQNLEELEALLPEMIGAAKLMKAAGSIEEFRTSYYHLSKLMIRWREWSTDSAKPWVAYCSMMRKSWLQLVPEIGNPYAGQSMPRCGSIVSEGASKKAG